MIYVVFVSIMYCVCVSVVYVFWHSNLLCISHSVLPDTGCTSPGGVVSDTKYLCMVIHIWDTWYVIHSLSELKSIVINIKCCSDV